MLHEKDFMPFPTSAETSSFMESLRFSGLKDLLEEQRPDLTGCITVTSHPVVKIDLPKSDTGYGRAVVAGLVKKTYPPHWLIIAPVTTSFIEMAWPADSSDEIVVEAITQVYDAALENEQPPSPWRWQQHSASTVVRVADRLAQHGLKVSAVVERNRLAPDAFEGARAPREVSRSFGDALRVDLGWGFATLARKPTLGWVLDANDHLVTRRLDLGLLVTGAPSASPGFMSDDDATLAQGVLRALGALWSATEGHVGDTRRQFSHPLLDAAAWWMTELGYGVMEVSSGITPAIEGRHHVDVCARRGTLGTVKAAFADASVRKRPLAMFSTQGFTKDAVAWADRADILLFFLDEESYRITGVSRLASESVPRVM